MTIVLDHWKYIHAAALKEWKSRPLLRLCHDTLEDWNQAVLMACVRAGGGYDPSKGRPTTYLGAVVLQAARDHCKHMKWGNRYRRAGEASLDAMRTSRGKASPGRAVMPDTSLDLRDECEALLRRVPSHSDRLMVRRCVMGGERQEDVGREYGVTRSGVSEKVRQATGHMRGAVRGA